LASLVDSQLAREHGIAGVEEMVNGCLCCVLVGQMETALRTLRGAALHLSPPPPPQRTHTPPARSHRRRMCVTLR
jgi:hypothetical protein